MSQYREKPLELRGVHTYPLARRSSKVSVRDFARPAGRNATLARWMEGLPHILAGDEFRAAVGALEKAHARRKPIIWGLGGHVIKCGLGPILIDLMKRGYVSAVAMNGAAMIHDFEIALAGATSEDVPAALGQGQFGMAEETGSLINQAISMGYRQSLGIGEAVGKMLCRPRAARFRTHSVLASSYARRIPVTVHPAIGADIIHNHPAVDAPATGGAAHRDFLLLASIVRQLDGGGVYLNVGSAVILPEVFLKCISLVANLAHAPRGITTINMDFIQHYRPSQNVVTRPVLASKAAGGKLPSRGIALTGHHEIMVPLLAGALKGTKPLRG
jgi:hypothetical protein